MSSEAKRVLVVELRGVGDESHYMDGFFFFFSDDQSIPVDCNVGSGFHQMFHFQIHSDKTMAKDSIWWEEG